MVIVLRQRVETLLMVKGIIKTCQENFKEGIYTQLNDICGCFLDIEDMLEQLEDGFMIYGGMKEAALKNGLEQINYKLSTHFGTDVLYGNPIALFVGANARKDSLRKEYVLTFVKAAVVYTYEHIDEYNNKNIF